MRRLIIRPGAIGDCILSLPAMEHLRADYTEVWVARQNVPLVRFADRVRAIQAAGLDMVGLPGVEPPTATMETLDGFDSIVSWYGAVREEFRNAVARLPFTFLKALPDTANTDESRSARAGASGGAGSSARGGVSTPPSARTCAMEPPPPVAARLRLETTFKRTASPHDLPGAAPMHAADWFLHQAGASGTAVPRIECPCIEGDSLRGRSARQQNGSGFAVIHPFSGSPKKNWPIERFRALAERLPLPVRWCAGPEEEFEGAVRFEDLYELACWLATARLYIGNDSGITHLAAAVGTPTVALFGPTDPRVWAPRGPCVTVMRGAGGSLHSIAVEEVLARLPE